MLKYKRLLLYHLILICTTCSAVSPSVKEELFDFKILPSGWHPLAWKNPSEPIFFDQEKLFWTELETGQTKGQININNIDGVVCTDSERNRLLLRQAYTTQTENMTSTRLKRENYLDLKQMKVFSLKEGEKYFHYGTDQCKIGTFKEGQDLAPPPLEGWTARQPQKLNFGHGVLFLYFSHSQPSSVKFLHADNNNQNIRELPLFEQAPLSDAKVIRSHFDAATSSYLVYQRENDFSSSSDTWPLTAFRFSALTKDLDLIKIPAGPWIKTYGIMDSLKAFSCGIRCYTKSELFMVDSRIFIVIHGKLVPEKVSGIYELTETGWIKRVALSPTEYKTVVTGPNRCHFGLHLRRQSRVVNICGTKTKNN